MKKKICDTMYGVILSMILTLTSNFVRADELSSDPSLQVKGHFTGETLWQGIPSRHGHMRIFSWPPNYWSISAWNGSSYASFLNRQFYYPTFGSISYSASKDILGGSWGQQTRYAAAQVSNFYCGEFDCKPVVWVQGGCAAVVISKNFGRIAWGTALNESGAWYTAEQACNQPNSAGEFPSDCQRRNWVCSY